MSSKEREFVTTQEASQQLGVSVGTVQNLVNKGFLSSVFTQGGHRRILTESLNQYREKMGYKNSEKTKCICVIHSGDPDDLGDIAVNKKMAIKIMGHPLELMDFEDHMDGIFIDAQSPWFDLQAMTCLNQFVKKFQVFIYNADALQAESLQALDPQVVKLHCVINGPIMDAYIHGKMH